MSTIAISESFKKQQQKAIWSIISFIVIYALLIIGAITLTGICCYLAFLLVTTIPNFIILIVAIGLISMGVLILIFLLKFMFKSSKLDKSHLLEIKQTEEPQLFTLIDEIVKKTNTKPPKKVYLSADVNAAVFYNSSFWSMFFPVRKNLLIGQGTGI